MQTEIKLQPNIVVIGGGTGSFTLLTGIKRYTGNITALVNMSDDGGSTGHLRDELGVLPPGDIRQCLVALSETEKVRDLFNYRFDEGSLSGSSFGNLFISAVEKMTDSFEQAIEVASDVLRITGKVLPTTLDDAKLIATTVNGTVISGQNNIGNCKLDALRPMLSFEQPVSVYGPAAEAIMDADIVVIAPGNLNGSIGPALIVDGMGIALQNTSAKVVCVTNLVTKPGQTDGFNVSDHAEEIERYCGGNVLDYVIYNVDNPTESMLEKYVRDGELVMGYVLDKLKNASFQSVGVPLIDKTPVSLNPADAVAHVRSLIRHDSDRVAREVMKIYFSD